MADVLAYLEAVVGADISDFRRNMAEVRGTLTETAGLGQSLQSVGSALTLGLTVPLALLGAASVKVFSDLDSAMRNVNSIMQLPEAQFEKLNQQVITFGENTRQGTTEAAQGLYAIVSAGFGVNNTADAMKLLAVASKTAEAGLADESSTAQLLAQSLLAYSASADQAQHFADVLTETVNLGVGSMTDFQSAFANVISTAALMKVSFGDLGGTLAFLTQRGMSASEAGTSLNQILTQMLKPTQGITDAYAKLGVASGTDLITKFGGLEGALKALIGTTDGSAESLANMFTNVRALRGVADIGNDLGAFNSLLVDFGKNVDGVTDKAQQQQMLSFSSQVDYMKSALQGLADVIGEKLAPMLTPLISGIKDFALTLANANPDVIQTAINIGLVAAALGPVIWLVGTLLSPLGLLATGIVLLAKAWSDNFLGIRTTITNALPAIIKVFNDIHLAVITFATNLAQDWYNIKTTVSAVFGDDFKNLLHDVFIGNWQGVLDDLGRIAVKIYNLFMGYIVNPITNFAKSTILPDLGKLIANLDPDTVLGVGIALGTLAATIAVTQLPTVIGALASAFSLMAINVGLMATALYAAATPIFVIMSPVLLAVGIFLAWQNNILGVRDAINKLGDALRTFFGGGAIDEFKQIAVIGASILGTDSAQDAYNLLYGKSMSDYNPNNSGVDQLIPQGGTKGNKTVVPGLPAPKNGYGTQGAIPLAPSHGAPTYIPTGSLGRSPYDVNPYTGNADIGQNRLTPTTPPVQNLVTIVTSDAQEVVNKLRAMGIDLQKRS